MPNNYFRFKEFTIQQEKSPMKVCTDSCLFGAWVANKIEQRIINPKTTIDIGTGTGLLSLMLAQKSGAQIHAIEIDKNSFDQASANFLTSPWNERVQAFHSDIKEWEVRFPYDLVVTNPPFYENDLLPGDSGKSVSKHSTTMRLKDLLLSAKKLLNEDGSFAVLLPWARTKWFENAAAAYSFFLKEKTGVKQTPQHDFFRAMLLLQNKKTRTLKNELIIKNDHNEYTAEFNELLKDYYLYL